MSDYERMGSPRISLLYTGGRFEVDTPEGIHVFDPDGNRIATKLQHRDKDGICYSLDVCRCGDSIDIHDEDGCHAEQWDDGEWFEDYCDCEKFEGRRIP